MSKRKEKARERVNDSCWKRSQAVFHCKYQMKALSTWEERKEEILINTLAKEKLHAYSFCQ